MNRGSKPHHVPGHQRHEASPMGDVIYLIKRPGYAFMLRRPTTPSRSVNEAKGSWHIHFCDRHGRQAGILDLEGLQDLYDNLGQLLEYLHTERGQPPSARGGAPQASSSGWPRLQPGRSPDGRGSKMDDELLERLYTEHHRQGNKYRKSVLERERARLFTSWIGQGKDVLDLGCRDGTLTRHWLDGNRVVGADIDADALAAARQVYGLEVHRVNLNAALPFPPASFDVVVLAETLEHLPYPRLTLAEIHRILRPNGLCIGNVLLAYHLNNRWRVLCGKRLDSDPTHVQYFSYQSLQELLQQRFMVERMVPLTGQPLAHYSMRLFARNVAWRCRKA